MEIASGDLSLTGAAILFAAGLASGICNVLAGGGSLITIPLLIFMGLESAAANGSNRVAILIQNVFAVAGFKRKGLTDARFCMLLVLPALPGAILGAVVASEIDDILFRRILSAVMIIVLILILTKKSPMNTGEGVTPMTRNKKIMLMFLFCGIGFYTGFIQAGVGFLIIAALHSFAGLDLVRTNSYKVFVIGVLTMISLMVFIGFGLVSWRIALTLAAGSALGGWLGSHVAVLGGEKWIKIFLTVSVIAMALKLSGLPDLMTR